MNTTQLKYFIETAESLNISKSAKKLFISQQALSSQILKLEALLGVTLFDRRPSLKLTYAGERFYNVAKDMLKKQAAIEQEFAEMNAGERGSVIIGISHTRGRVFLPLVLPKFHELFPRVELKLKEGNSKQLKTYLDNGSVDFVFTADQFSNLEYEKLELVKEKLFWVYTERYQEEMEQGKFETVPFLLMIKENRIRGILDQYFDRKSISPHILVESDNIETVLALATKGMGVTVYPEMFLNCLKPGTELKSMPLDDSSTDTVLVAAWKKGKYVSKFEKALLEICKGAI